MCRIRLLFKDSENNVIRDTTIDIQTSIMPLDRPSYVEVYGIYTKYLKFFYSGSEESDFENYNLESLFIKFSKASGRIYEFKSERNMLVDMERKDIEDKMLKKVFSDRIRENVMGGIEFANDILKEIKNTK